MQRNLQLEELIKPIINKLGYSFEGLEYILAPNGATLRIYIDSEQGISADNCQKVSYQVDNVLTVEGNISDYALEVSSPGINKKLFFLEQFVKEVGSTIKISLSIPIETQRNFKGKLKSVEGEHILLYTEDGTDLKFDFENIDKAQVVPEW